MDVGERLFEIFSNWRRHQRDEDRRAFQYELTDCEKALALLVQPLFEDPVEIHAAKQSGVVGMAFYLPPAISFFRSRQRNRDLYLHQILMMASAQKLNLCWPRELEEDRERAAYFLQKRSLILQQLTEFYPGFRSFNQQLMQEFQAQPEGAGNSWLLWGGLSSGPGFIRKENDPKRKSQNRSKEDRQQNIETSFEREEVDLEKEKENLVTHSFEKMETADEYEGGARTADGSDQLEEHSEALKELKLKKVTRSGEAAAAFLNSDVTSATEVDAAVAGEAQAQEEILYYPEWHCKKKKYQPNHCRLVVSTPESSLEPDLVREKLFAEHGTAIAKSKQQLLQICNQRKWRNQQADGSEIDIDAFVRHLSDLRNKVPSSGRFYANQFLRNRDFQVLVLVDLSLSTDSYVENLRVLDVELESVGLIGLLSGGLRENTIVAGTYSETRNFCAFEYLKHGHEDWNMFYKRVPGVLPRGYTRLAPAIRHATRLLSQSDAKNKILLILTDGKPTDYDGYEGRYGIEDIRKACLEAQSRQILTKAFAIEKTARHYFPQMFGSFEILPSAAGLPQSLVKTFLHALNK